MHPSAEILGRVDPSMRPAEIADCCFRSHTTQRILDGLFSGASSPTIIIAVVSRITVDNKNIKTQQH